MICTYQKDGPDSLTKLRFHHDDALVSYFSPIRWLWLELQLYNLPTVIIASYSIPQHLCISVLTCRVLSNTFLNTMVIVKTVEDEEKTVQSVSQD